MGSSAASLIVRIASAVVLGTTSSFSLAATSAEQFPAKNVSLIVPYAAGGPSDSMARMIAPVFEQVLERTTIVENFAGGGGSIGANKILREPDGHQVLVSSPNEVILTPLAVAAVKYTPEDFRLIGVIGEFPYVLVGRPDLPAEGIDELIAYARARADKPLTYGSMGNGSMNHLAGEEFAVRIGTELIHVPYKGGAPLVQDIMGGQLDMAFTPLSGNVPGLIESGKLKSYGITSSSRMPSLQDMPTVNEGKTLNNFVYSIWVGPAVARSTPQPVVNKVRAAFEAAMKNEGVRKSLQGLGAVEGQKMSLAEADSFYRDEIRKFGDTAKAINLQAQ